MNYPGINGILELVRARLDDGAFAEVKCGCITSYENIYKLMPELTSYPAAIIFAGDVEIENAGMSRDVEIAVLLLDEFHATPDECANSGYNLVDAVCAKLTGETPGAQLRIGNVNFLFEGVRALDVDQNRCAWLVTLNARAGAGI